MNCPTCGISVEADQQFCRTCGTGLTKGAPRRVRPQLVTLIAVLITFTGIMTALGGDMAGVRWLKFTGVFIAIAGMFSMIAGSLVLEMLSPRRSVQTTSPKPTAVGRADTTNKLLPVGENDSVPRTSPAGVPSVVEDTTELLKIPRSRSQTKKDGPE